MNFKELEYILPVCIPAIVLWVVEITLSLIVIKRNRMNKFTFLPPRLAVIALSVLLVSFIYMLNTVTYWGPLLGSDRAQTEGVVEEIDKTRSFALYWDRRACKFVQPSKITIGGTQYYILTDTGLEEGMNIDLKYCPDGNTILQWELHGQWQPSEPEIITQPVTDQAHYTPIISSNTYILLSAVILVVLMVAQKHLERLRIINLLSGDYIKENYVGARKISTTTCSYELLITILFLLSILTLANVLIIFMFGLTCIMWGIRISIMRTNITYHDDYFTYTSWCGTKKYHISDVYRSEMVLSEQNYMFRLILVLNNGSQISFHQKNFYGLEQFSRWLNQRENNRTGDGLREPK